MKCPRNTTAEVNANPMIALLDAMGGPGGIERSEKRGQSELVDSDVIPSRGIDEDTDKRLVELGFVLGQPVKGDPIFREALLPDGWKRKGSDHAMWSYIVDETGKERCAIFYKAAFYDRSAFIRVTE